MRRTVLLGLTVLALSITPLKCNSESDEEWENYKTTFNKTYEPEEEIKYRTAFEDSLKTIRIYNEKHELGEVNFTLGLNELSDLPPEELKTGFSGGDNFSSKVSKVFFSTAFRNTPTKMDWRERNVITGVKRQGKCNSCWAFAVTGAIEAQHAIKTGRLVSLSEQNLVDCSYKNGNNKPCEYGYPDRAYKYVIENGGIDTEDFYSYNENYGSCQYKSNFVGAKISSYENVQRGSENALKQVVATVGPVSVCLNGITQSFRNYRRGVYNNPSCSNNPKDSDHCVLVIGYGTDNGEDYWLVKNSWGTSWGEDGYCKMSRNRNNQCGIANWGTYPIIN